MWKNKDHSHLYLCSVYAPLSVNPSPLWPGWVGLTTHSNHTVVPKNTKLCPFQTQERHRNDKSYKILLSQKVHHRPRCDWIKNIFIASHYTHKSMYSAQVKAWNKDTFTREKLTWKCQNVMTHLDTRRCGPVWKLWKSFELSGRMLAQPAVRGRGIAYSHIDPPTST